MQRHRPPRVAIDQSAAMDCFADLDPGDLESLPGSVSAHESPTIVRPTEEGCSSILVPVRRPPPRDLLSRAAGRTVLMRCNVQCLKLDDRAAKRPVTPSPQSCRYNPRAPGCCLAAS